MKLDGGARLSQGARRRCPVLLRRAMEAPILRFDQFERRRSEPTPRVTLEITRGKAQQRLRPLQGKVFLIGTASDCDLVLGDLNFPEVYAYLFVDGSEVTIRRLGSGPALIVSGDRTDKAELFQGDEVRFGPFELRVIIGRAALAGDGQAGDDDEPLEDEMTLPAVLRFCPREHCTL